MTRIDKVLKKLSELYEFNRSIKGYVLRRKERANRVAGGFSPPAPTPPGMRVRTGRCTKITGP